MSLLAKYLGPLCEMYLVTSKSKDPIEMDGARVINITMKPSRFRRVVRDINAVLDEVSPDVVHISGIWEPQTWWMQREAQRRGIKVLLAPHGMLEPWIVGRNRLKKLAAMFMYEHGAISRADCLYTTALTERNNIWAQEFFNDIAVIPNGLDVDNIAIKSSWTPTKNILYISRIHPKKGLELLIDAAESIRERLKGYRIIIGGNGEAEYVEYLKSAIINKGLSHIFEFPGWLDDEVKRRAMLDADVFVLPTYSENFGMVVAEALACGTPVITTSGTPWQEIQTEGCGWYIETGSAAALAAALAEAVGAAPAAMERMGRAGRRLVGDKYSADVMAARVKQVYDWMLGEAPMPDFVYRRR